MARRDFYVYGWFRDLACTQIFYVGKGTGLRHQHWKELQRNHNLHLVRIVRKVVKQYGFVPTQRLWKHLTNAQACGLEIRTVAEIGRYPNGPLVNMTDAGTGGPMPPERAREHSKRMKGRPAHNKGKPMSPEQRAKISATLTGRPPPNKGVPMSETQRNKLLGHPVSDTARAKMSAAKKGKPSPKKGKPLPPHQVEAMRQRQLGKKDSSETRQKKSNSVRNSWAHADERRAAMSVRMKAHWAKMNRQSPDYNF